MAASLSIKRYDTRTAVKATLKSPSGASVDLTDATVKFSMVKYSTTIVNREADIIDALTGKVAFVFDREELAETGTMKAEFQVAYPDGSVETFPNSGYITINIEANLT
ncbi:phage baseplate upper protein [Paenibacillus sp. HWE-109]|uniref:BppU family phage baseplate upper protein n=1 Tax=Paenibacillus sp. HWE-109 TaxID=1306526 RepID=UPI001EDCD29A|nr:BppU family phage baseplate upper protein [Paenibacillus sp. HWE-109]UKS30164.1 phage baseplate upper protein [Paenibacillus sp. HWE-109]